ADLDISSQTNWGSSSNYAVGNSTNSFKANYDGDGHSVKLGVTTSTTDCPIGIFGVIGEGSAISNLTSTGSISATTKSAAGGVVGSVTGAATINSCNNNATIKNTLSGMYYIGTGGICGHIDAPSCNVSIVNCSNNGTVTVNQLRAGGILGCHDDGILTISGCVNNSAISQTSSQSNMASGGIVGHMYSSSGSATVSGCTNNGTVTGYINVGGIIGRTEKVTVVSGCSNTNAISSYTSGSSYHYNIGGVVGSANNTLTLQGTISQTGNVTGWYYVGGVVGYMNSTLTVDENAEIEVNATVKYCGSVTCTTYSTTTCATACATGGFAGYCNYLQINGNVTVSGAVTHNGTAYRCVGGLVGVIGGQSKTDCYLNAGSKAKITNNASVEGAYYVGGFVGWAQKMTLTNGSNWHKNIGDVTGTLYTGGVVGHVQNASSTFNRCVNEGAVQGSYHVGGLVGKANLATSFAYCLNYGAITATSYASQSGVAGIVGSAGSGALTFSKCKNEGNINGINGSTTLYVAGISGYTNVNVTMSDCGNTGTITGRGYGVSGLVAMCRTTSTIINSYNQGNIVYSNTTNTGGGITSAYNTKPTITNCYFSGVPSNTGSLSNYANMSGSYNNSSSYKATCSNCYSIDQTTKGSNNAAANYTISLNNDAEYITSNSGAYLVTALNNWQSSNTSYNSWVASDYTELPHLSWEDNLNL
ncbi:MAG: cell wall-binding protein, partial [bacterium P3]